MPDVVRYVWYELLATFLGAVASPLLISDSDFGSEQIVPAAPVLARHPCIMSKTRTYICILAWETFQIKKYHSRSNRVLLFALEYTWHCSLAFRRRNASEKCHVYSNGKSETRFQREWCCVSIFFRWRKTFVNWYHGSKIQERLRKASRSVGSVARVGRSVGRKSCWSVRSLKLIEIIIFGRNSVVLRSHLNVYVRFAKLYCYDIARQVGRKGL